MKLRKAIQVTVRATGKLEAVTTVEIGAEVTGRVLDVKVDTNDLVTSGQLLAEIDKTELLATIEQTSAQVVAADANIAQCNATLVEANLAYARCVTLREKNVLSQEQLDTANAVKLVRRLHWPVPRQTRSLLAPISSLLKHD